MITCSSDYATEWQVHSKSFLFSFIVVTLRGIVEQVSASFKTFDGIFT